MEEEMKHLSMNSISLLFKNNPVTKRDRIIPLDFTNTPALPDSHVWSRPQPSEPITIGESTVPVIDLTHPNLPALLRHACDEWGVFHLTNHGVPQSLLIDVEHHMRRLFSLPIKCKILAARSPDEPTGYGLARISTFFTKRMWSEGFSIMGSSARHAALLWPNDHSQFCQVMEEYQKAMEVLSHKLICTLMGSLGLTHEDMDWLRPNKTRSSKPETQSLLQLNSYPICPDPNQAMGLAPHTDSSLFTILYQGNIPGLQIQRPEEGPGWIPVDPAPGALVVNLGDLLHIVSNGRFKSTLHRVVVNSTRHRVSAAYFYGPPRDVTIGPCTKLVNRGHPPIYRDVTWDQYLETKATHFNKTLALFRR